MVEAGASLDIQNLHGSTALSIALKQGKLEIAKLLLRAGAKVSPQDEQLITADMHLQ